MTTFEITYIRTGRVDETDRVHISTCDERKNGERVNDIIGAIEYFEELAEDWGTYENRNAIVSIKNVYEN